jgi:hypothetical protein
VGGGPPLGGVPVGSGDVVGPTDTATLAETAGTVEVLDVDVERGGADVVGGALVEPITWESRVEV